MPPQCGRQICFLMPDGREDNDQGQAETEQGRRAIEPFQSRQSNKTQRPAPVCPIQLLLSPFILLRYHTASGAGIYGAKVSPTLGQN